MNTDEHRLRNLTQRGCGHGICVSLVLGICVHLCSSVVSFCLAAESPWPNFVIFIADDVSWDDVGPYGNPRVHTPNIDRLAGEGMRSARAILTTSSCSPSRCSILTGRYPHATGAAELHMPLPADQVL